MDNINPEEITIFDEESLKIIVEKLNEVIDWINDKKDQLL